MRNGMVMWDEIINEVAEEFPDVVSLLLSMYPPDSLRPDP